MNQHRLIIDPQVIKDDYTSAQGYPSESILKYQLVYQLSRITRDRGAITHDDRLDALAIAVNYWVEQMAQDADKAMLERKEELINEGLNRFMDSYYKTTGSINAPKVSSWI